MDNHADVGVRIDQRRVVRPPPGLDVEVGGQRHGHRGAQRAVADGLVVDDPVEGHLQRVAHTLGLDDHRLIDIERERDAEQRLEGVALRPARRATVAALVAHQHGEVAQAGDDLGRDPGTVVANGDERDLVVFVGAGGDLDDRCSSGGLGGVKRVVEQLLDDDVPERIGVLPGLRLQRLQLQELGGSRRGEHGALYGGPLSADVGHGLSPSSSWMTSASVMTSPLASVEIGAWARGSRLSAEP